MRIYIDSPQNYSKFLNTPLFDQYGEPTERVFSGLENLLDGYVYASKIHARSSDNNPNNYEIEKVYIVGSGADRNEPYSDIDFLFIAPKLDLASSNAIKVALAMMFFCDRPKNEAIDVFIRKEDAYPNRASINITNKVGVQILLNRYMNKLLKE